MYTYGFIMKMVEKRRLKKVLIYVPRAREKEEDLLQLDKNNNKDNESRAIALEKYRYNR